MAVYRLLKYTAFDPERIERVTQAYEDALSTLGLVDRSDPLTELLAKKIIEIAQTGERDPMRIRTRAIAEL